MNLQDDVPRDATHAFEADDPKPTIVVTLPPRPNPRRQTPPKPAPSGDTVSRKPREPRKPLSNLAATILGIGLGLVGAVLIPVAFVAWFLAGVFSLLTLVGALTGESWTPFLVAFSCFAAPLIAAGWWQGWEGRPNRFRHAPPKPGGPGRDRRGRFVKRVR